MTAFGPAILLKRNVTDPFICSSGHTVLEAHEIDGALRTVPNSNLVPRGDFR